MKKYSGNWSRTLGLAPGTLVHIGSRKTDKIVMTQFEYDEDNIVEKQLSSIDEFSSNESDNTVRWINIDGLHNIEILEKLGEQFSLHPLVLEDMLNTEQRPKIEDYDSYLFIVAKMLSYNNEKGLSIEQQSFVLNRDTVITVGEKEGDVFEPVRERLRNGSGRIRKLGADYLLYSLLDAIVDSYFVVLEKLGDTIELAEEELISRPLPETLKNINNLKRDLLYMHKSIWALREVAASLERGDSELVRDTTHIYIRDVYDHVIQVMDTTETYRDILSGMLDIYLSSQSNKMNEIMKVLTVISTLFIPLTFIVGLYGMNFRFMPELEWHWGYYAILLVMVGVVITMIMFFKRKKWF